MQATVLARFTKVAIDPPSALNNMACSLRVPDELQQPGVLLGPLGPRTLQPGIEAGTGNL